MSAPTNAIFMDYNRRKLAYGFCNIGLFFQKSKVMECVMDAIKNAKDMQENYPEKIKEDFDWDYDWERKWFFVQVYDTIRSRKSLHEEYCETEYQELVEVEIDEDQ